jgi:hypothetical protein
MRLALGQTPPGSSRGLSACSRSRALRLQLLASVFGVAALACSSDPATPRAGDHNNVIGDGDGDGDGDVQPGDGDGDGDIQPGDGDGDGDGDIQPGDGDEDGGIHTGDGGGEGDGGGDAPDAGPEEPQQNQELCQLKGSQVAVLGDSYVALDPSYILLDTHPFVRNLEDLARAAGALEKNDAYRRYAQSGASMAYEPAIPKQLDAALKANPDIKLVIMDGGGNDILVNNRGCLEYATLAELKKDQACLDVVDNAIAAGQELFDKGVEAGVEAVVYFFYPHLPGAANGGIGAGTHPNVVLDYAYPLVRKFCERQTAAPCYFVDTRKAFDKDRDGLPDPGMINIDGIHPTAESSKILASEVWKVMDAQCLASEPATP